MDWIVAEEAEHTRVDKYVADQMEAEISRNQVQQWIREGLVSVNGLPVKSNYKVVHDDTVHVIVPEPVELEVEPEPIPLEIVYEDADVIVINKKRGMVVHPAPGHISGTLVNALLHHCQDLSGINGVLRPGIVHRIDKDTSGLLMAAKNDTAHISLSAQLRDHTVTRKYIAIVHGNVAHEQGTIDAPIGRDPQDRKLFTVIDRSSKHAVSHFAVVERFKEATMVELQLETGRTHQIRVHMKFIGHPLIGDPVYGRSKGSSMNGQALHAAVLGFTHPRTGKHVQFSSPLPEDMNHLLETLKNQ